MNWMGVDPEKDDEFEKFKKVWDESFKWFQSQGNKKAHLKELSDVGEHIASLDNFSEVDRKQFLSDLRDIACADGVFDQGEKEWHDIAAQQLGIDVRVSRTKEEIIEMHARIVNSTRRIGFVISTTDD